MTKNKNRDIIKTIEEDRENGQADNMTTMQPSTLSGDGYIDFGVLDMQDITYTAADALNDALLQAGVSHIFLNSGTDYPPLIESWAKFKAEGHPMPEIIISPHETAAMSAAQGFAQLTGRPQAVFVHVDVGTQNLGGTVHNAFRCRVPVFILAGISPFTMENELKGGRNAHIQFIQNISDQNSIVREYVKLCCELRSGKNIQQMALRALQIAKSDPKGPVYLTAAREVLEEESLHCHENMDLWDPVSPSGLDEKSLDIIAQALSEAKNPLILTSYSGRNPECVRELEALSAKLAVPVVETNPSFMNFPASNPMHLGYESHEFVDKADLILIIDCDLPWIPAHTRPKAGCHVFHIDCDPLKENIPLWYIRADRSMKADAYTALKQLRAKTEDSIADNSLIEKRRETVHALHKKQREDWKRESLAKSGLTPEFLTHCLSEIVDEDTIVLNETITDRPVVDRLLPRNKPGTTFSSGGSSLGWHGGAAVGMKLAQPEKDVIALTGDGTYIFSCPTAVHWMSAKYNAPFLTVIYNNQGWNAPKQITIGEHPDGYAAKTNSFWTSFNPTARLDLTAAAAGGAFAATVSDPSELRKVLSDAKQSVKNGISAVVNVLLPPV